MKRSALIFLGLLLMSGLLGVGDSVAQAPKAGSEKTNVSSDKGKENGAAAAVSVLKDAGDLVRYARDNESPVAMLTAVQMIQRVRFQEGSNRLGAKKSDATQGAEQGKEGGKAQSPAVTFDTQKLLAEAKGWAHGNQHLLALIGAESAKHTPVGTLGAESGPIVHRDSVLGRHRDNYTVTFTGGELARVAVIGDGDTDLDVYIYDENGNLITSDTDYTDKCLVEFTPRWTGRFVVQVVNNGYVYNNYLLLSN